MRHFGHEGICVQKSWNEMNLVTVTIIISLIMIIMCQTKVSIVVVDANWRKIWFDY